MLDHARLPRTLWGEAALCAAYLFNRSESRALSPGITPYEALHGSKPDLSHLRVFGARCFARIPAELQVKLGPRSREAIFMGYPPGVKAWRCRDKESGTFFNSRDVIFDKSFSTHPFPTDDSDDDDSPAAPVVLPPPSLVVPPPLPSAVPPSTAVGNGVPAVPVTRRSSRARPATERGQLYQQRLAADKERLARQREIRHVRIRGVPPPDPSGDIVAEPSTLPIRPPPPLISPPPSVSDSGEDEDAIRPDPDTVGFSTVLANLIIVELAGIALRSDSRRNPQAPGYDIKIPPKTYDEALRRSDRDLWLAAMRKEMNLMSEMNVYELVYLPAERRAIGCRWVLEFKTDLKGGSTYKARLVAQGFSQVPGVDFGKTFAPVAKSTSIRVISALAALNDWELDSFDAKRAFLWGKLQEDVYMRQPPGFEQSGPGGERLVCHLLSSLYGLKQATYDWYELLREVLTHLGFLCCDADYAVFVYDRVGEGGERIICIIAWHVDDGLAAANNKSFLAWIKGQIGERFGITDLGAVKKYLGIQFERDRATRELWMHQADYITYLLEEHGMHQDNYGSLFVTFS